MSGVRESVLVKKALGRNVNHTQVWKLKSNKIFAIRLLYNRQQLKVCYFIWLKRDDQAWFERKRTSTRHH